MPLEAQWEYAARGGQKSQSFSYAGGNKLKEVGWYSKNSHGETKLVGLKHPNELDLYDMSGNVLEWCLDYWYKNYEGAPKDDSARFNSEKAKDAGAYRIVRGGSCSINYDGCHVSVRSWDYVISYNNDYIGFRVLRYLLNP